jgi:gamma-glutamylcyclotransferase (GGCT)/AIG2-like uncharacterized protein YtfP
VHPVFVYGTLRRGSSNHDRWLAPWLAPPCGPARLAGHALQHHGGLPYIVSDPARVVAGHVADLGPATPVEHGDWLRLAG